jgi:acetoin utilization deacetylase AcuC-like enzyme
VRITPRAATEEELAWVHTPDYIATVAATAGGTLGSFDLDTQTTANSYATAKLAVGGIFSLIDTLYTQTHQNCAMACVRPPGHHAEADHAMGFCLFNNSALAAMYLKHRHQVQRVLIADLDVHHGNGIQHIFYDSADVLYFSIHQFPHYPGTGKLSEIGSGKGEGYTVNVPLSKGRSDKAYAKILHFLLSPIARVYRPDIIIVPLGFDLYPLDPLGQMNVSEDGYALMTYILKQIANSVCNGRILFILEGGYSLEGLRTCGRRVLQELAGIPTLSRDYIEQIAGDTPESLPELKKAIEVHRKYWPVLAQP